MIGIVRGALQLASIATAAMAIWLTWVVLVILPSRDPGHVQVWAVVALASAALVMVSILATRGGGAVVLGLLTLLSIAAVSFGLLAVGSFLTTVASGDSEGYLIVIGFILAIHGTLGLLWAAIEALRWRSSFAATRQRR